MVLPTRLQFWKLFVVLLFSSIVLQGVGFLLSHGERPTNDKGRPYGRGRVPNLHLAMSGAKSSRTSFRLRLPYFSPTRCLRLLHVGFANILPTPI